MKKVLSLLLLVIFSHACAQFEFVDHKTNGALSKKFMSELIAEFHPRIFFEAGRKQEGGLHRLSKGAGQNLLWDIQTRRHFSRRV